MTLKKIHKKHVRNTYQGGKSVYRVCCGVDNIGRIESRRYSMNGVTINVHPSVNTKVYRKIIKERYNLAENNNDIKPEHYRKVDIIASVSAYSISEAYNIGSRIISLYLGCVNLIVNINKVWRVSFSRPRKALNLVIRQPFTTVHRNDGSLFNQSYWYEDWSKPQNLDKKDGDRVNLNMPHVWQHVKKSKWRSRSIDALVNYYEAFSNTNHHNAFLDGWRVLEKIGGQENCSNDVLIKRAANTFSDTDLSKQIAIHLKYRRNKITHDSIPIHNDEETVMFQMNTLISLMLLMFVRNQFGFKRPEDFWELLDIPTDSDDLKSEERDIERRRHLIDCIKKFRRIKD